MKLPLLTCVLSRTAAAFTLAADHGSKASLLGALRSVGSTGAPLAAEADALGGILSAVEATVSQLQTSLTPIASSCSQQVTKLQARKSAHDATNVVLYSKREEETVKVAKYNVEVEQLSTQETGSRASYDAAVGQRATEQTSYVDAQAADAEQAEVISNVLTKLREKQTQVSVGRTVAGATSPAAVQPGEKYVFYRTSTREYPESCKANMLVEVVQVNATGAAPAQVRWDDGSVYFVELRDLRVPVQVSTGSSGFGTVVGVFTGMLDTLNRNLASESKEYSERDDEMKTLVASYKTGMDHTYTQYGTKHNSLVSAQAGLQMIKDEQGIRDFVGNVEKEKVVLFEKLCGGGPGAVTPGGDTKALETKASRMMADLTTEAEQALLTIQALANANPSFLQVAFRKHVASTEAAGQSGKSTKSKRVKVATSSPALLQGLATARGAPPSAGRPSPGRAGRWLADAAAHGLAPLAVPPKLAEAPQAGQDAMALSRGAELRKLASVLPSVFAVDKQALEVLAHKSDAGGGGQAKASTVVANAPNLTACIADKKDITAQIMAAQAAERNAQVLYIWNQLRIPAGTVHVQVVQDTETQLAAAANDVVTSFSTLDQLAEAGSWTTDLGTALSNLGVIETNITTYIANGAPLQASALPPALTTIKSLLVQLRDEVPQAYAQLRLDRDQISRSVSDSVTQLAGGRASLDAAKLTSQTAANDAQQTVQARQAQQVQLKQQRTIIEARCEPAA